MTVSKLTDEQLKQIVWERRYCSDEKAVNMREDAATELVERGYPEID